MAHSPVLWQQGGSYPAQADRQLLATLWPTGGLLGGAVTAVANAMTVTVAPGSAGVALQPGQGTALCHWDAAEPVGPLDPAPPSGESRIDLIVCQVRDPDIDGGANRDFVFAVVKGTAATTPTTPAVPQNALALCAVTVPGGAANLNSAIISPRAGGLAVASGVPAGRIHATSIFGALWRACISARVYVLGNWSVDFVRGSMTYESLGATGVLHVPVTAIYRCSFSVLYSGNSAPAPAGYYNAQLMVNGAAARQQSGSLARTDSVPSYGASDLVPLNAGDAVGLGTMHGPGNVYTTPGTPSQTFVSVELATT